jgi:ABC-type branched-subunit amino acid transport system substrate-binding protein
LQQDSFVNIVGVNNFFFSHEGIGPAVSQDENYEHFVGAYSDRFGADPPEGTYAAQAYDATYLAVLGLESISKSITSSVNANEIRQAILENTNGSVVYGPTSFREAVEAVSKGEKIDFHGASSLLDFDVNGVVSPPVFNLWAVKNGIITILEKGVSPAAY